MKAKVGLTCTVANNSSLHRNTVSVRCHGSTAITHISFEYKMWKVRCTCECNVIITDRNDDQSYENKASFVTGPSFPLSECKAGRLRSQIKSHLRSRDVDAAPFRVNLSKMNDTRFKMCLKTQIQFVCFRTLIQKSETSELGTFLLQCEHGLWCLV